MTRQRVIPFIGGEWHGEGYEASVLPQKVLTNVGMPPRYIGNDQYDAFVSHLGHEAYYLKVHDGKFYYVAESWAEDFPANIDMPHETSNGKRMREEVETNKRRDLRDHVERNKKRLLEACIAKHMAIDRDSMEDEASCRHTEYEVWEFLRKAFEALDKYKGEPPMTKERLKV